MKAPAKKTKLTVKQKKTQRTVIIVLIVIVLIALYFKFRTPKDDSSATGTPSSSANGSASGSGMKRVGNDTTLKYGTNAEEVKWVQSGYNAKYAAPLGMTKLVVDGKFGTKTQNAVVFVTGKTTTSWTIFKGFMDNKATPPTSQNLFYDPNESVWPWETES